MFLAAEVSGIGQLHRNGVAPPPCFIMCMLSLLLRMSKPWIWSSTSPVSSPLSPWGALHRLAGVAPPGPCSPMDAAKHQLK